MVCRAWIHEDDVILGPPRERGTYEDITENITLITDTPFSLMRYSMYYVNL